MGSSDSLNGEFALLLGKGSVLMTCLPCWGIHMNKHTKTTQMYWERIAEYQRNPSFFIIFCLVSDIFDRKINRFLMFLFWQNNQNYLNFFDSIYPNVLLHFSWNKWHFQQNIIAHALVSYKWTNLINIIETNH